MEHLQVSEAQRVILESVAALGAEPVKLEQSLGRVLAEDIRANRDIPPTMFPRWTAMRFKVRI